MCRQAWTFTMLVKILSPLTRLVLGGRSSPAPGTEPVLAAIRVARLDLRSRRASSASSTSSAATTDPAGRPSAASIGLIAALRWIAWRTSSSPSASAWPAGSSAAQGQLVLALVPDLGAAAVLGLAAALAYRFDTDELRRQCPGCGRVVKLHDALCTRCGDRAGVPRGGDRAGVRAPAGH